MKKILIILVTIFLISCQKEEELPSEHYVDVINAAKFPNPYGSKDSIPIGRYGKFVVVDAKTYITTSPSFKPREYYKFNNFQDGIVSSLRIDGKLFAIDEIIKNQTTYEFIQTSGNQKYSSLKLNGNDSYAISDNLINSRYINFTIGGMKIPM